MSYRELNHAEQSTPGELVLELLCEEIPARMQRRAIDDFANLLRQKLAAAEIPAESLRGYVTPRRLAVIATGIPPLQPDRSEERRGPRVGAPPPAIDGFLRAAGLVSVDQCEVRDTGRGEFYFAVLRHSGRPAFNVLPEVIQAAMAELPWPKSMRYPAAALRWVRPLTSILCLYDGKPLSLPLSGIPAGDTTRGHRFLAPEAIRIGDARGYLDRLDAAYVILDQDRRRGMIREDLDRVAKDQGLTVLRDEGLLDEVTGLVEFPVVLSGAIDAEFMTLPAEVLATAMRTHQKYFSCVNPNGTAAPRFLFVANNLTNDDGKTVIAGNERVLRARLADARFFWDQDRKTRLEDRIAALEDRVFHVKLGSLAEKVRRMEALVPILVQHVPGAEEERSRRAVRLAKADLSAGMVGEFPELQGIIGRYYALHDGEDAQVADAIAEHYKPLGPNDSCPSRPESVVAALADKIDSLVAFFTIGEKPTGSHDPFALRRAALGLIRLIVDNQLHLPLGEPFRQVAERLAPGSTPPTDELLAFLADRLKVHLREQGIRHDRIAAVFARLGDTRADDDILRLVARAEALEGFVSSEDGANLLTAYRRASNIVAIEERRDGRLYDENVVPEALRESEERLLFDYLVEVGERAGTVLAREEFAQSMTELARLRRPIDNFFEKITVNTDEPVLRDNRLRLLSRIRATMNQVADFSQIEG